MPDPYFSIVVTTYDRARIVRRCVDSCLSQSDSGYEVVVVDDASSDETVPMLQSIDDPHLRLVVHESNRGISPSRHTGVANSRGEWILVIDSDWELFPDTLERLRSIIADLPEGVRVVRGRILWDDGRVTPSTVPEGLIDYEARIRWMEADWIDGADAVQCFHRSVFDDNPYFSDRRGLVESLYELNLAKVALAVGVPDVLGKEYTDAENSWVRSVDAAEVIPRLLSDAPDMLWMVETTLSEHGAALSRHAPRAHRMLIRMASSQAFLVGDRRTGLRYGLEAARLKKLDPMPWISIALGLLGPKALARGTLAHRRLMRRTA